ncbi:MAG: preprotein translocase subunit YajC [Acidimicrobiales bacterium]
MYATLAIYAGIIAIFYVLVLLPQQRRQKATRELLAALSVGDEVVLESGIHGFISELENNVVWLEVAPNVELKVSRSAIASRLVTDAADKAES